MSLKAANHTVYIQPQNMLWQEGCVPGKVVPLKAFCTPTVGLNPAPSRKASSFPYVAGGSAPSQLEAFKFKTKQNNPFLGSFFPSSIFVKNPISPERSGSRNPESKYVSASSALLKLLGCSGEEAAFIATSCGGQQISWPSGYNSQVSLGQQKEALTYF